MKPLFALLLIPLLGCNGIVSFQTGFLSNGFQTVSGVVSIVQITTIFANDGTKTIVTIVTFLAPTSTITFCGSLIDRFVMNSFTTVRFTPGLPCASLISVFTV